MRANRLSSGRAGGPARSAIRTAAVLAAVFGVAALIDRYGLLDAVRTGDGRLLCRCQVVPRPASVQGQHGGVFVRPTAGPAAGRILPAIFAAELAGRPEELTGASVIAEFPADGGPPVVRAIARDRLLLALAAGVVGLIALVAGGAAYRLLPALLAGIGAVLGVLIPCLLGGVSPLLGALAAAGLLFLAAAMLIGRASRRSVAILAGAFGGLAVAAGLSLLAVHAGRLTGVYSPLTSDLWYDKSVKLDFRLLLAAGMIVGACGIILDLAVAVTAAVAEVARADPHLPRRRLAAAGLAVGRDVMGTELNTLIFAYAGANFGVLLLPSLGAALRGYEMPAFRVLSQQDVAVGIFQMLAGTTALVLTIPLTAGVAAMVLGPRRPRLGPAAPARARQPVWKWAVCAGLFMLAWVGCSLWQRSRYHRYGSRPADRPDTARFLVQARVERVQPAPEDLPVRPGSELLQRADVVLVSGPLRGQKVAEVPNAVSGFPGSDKILSAGDSVLLRVWTRGTEVAYATVIDFARGGLLVHLGFVLAAVVLLLGRGQGLRALAALGVSAAVLYAAILLVGAAGQKAPAGEAAPTGGPPAVALPIFLAAGVPLCGLVFLIIAGWGRKALAGAGGTFGGLLVGGLCALLAAHAMRLSGRTSVSMAAVRVFTPAAQLDYRGLLQAGMVLGIAGAGMDVAMAVVSAVQQVRLVNRSASGRELFRCGLEVGRGIMVPMVLVLTFAFLGLSLPVLLLPARLPGLPVSVWISNEHIAVQVLRIMVGAVGVVCTVPIAAALAAWLFARQHATDKDTHANAGTEHRAVAGR